MKSKLSLSVFLITLLSSFYCHAQQQHLPPIHWKDQQVETGILWRSFFGYAEVFGSNQSINILEVDLSRTDKRLRFSHAYDSARLTTLDTMAMASEAIAAINGTYADSDTLAGKAQYISYFKVNGIEHQTVDIPFDHPLAWKSEGCFYITSDDKVGIERGNKAYYTLINAPHILSGSPVLIQDGLPVGKYFVPQKLSGVPASMNKLVTLDYENPYRHQGVRHPRTAIGIKDKTTVYLVTVDGRTKEAAGMTAKELTTLLFDYLGCQDALNLDGGGSTAMYIRDQTENGIVNYPTDNLKLNNNIMDHYGLRKIPNGIMLVNRSQN